MFNKDDISSLVRALGKGSIKAFDKLYLRFRPKVDRVLSSMLGDGNSQIIEDLAQNIFLKVWEKRTLIAANVTDFDAYLFRMTKNEALNYIQRKSIPYLTLDDAVSVLSPDDVALSLEEKQMQAQVTQIVESLPSQRKKVFELSRQEHLSNQEIADRLGISLKTVERHMTLALKDIKNHLS